MHAKCFVRLQLNKVITNRLNCHKKQYETQIIVKYEIKYIHYILTLTHTHTHTRIHTYVLVYCHLMWNYIECAYRIIIRHWLRLCHEQYHEQISKWSNKSKANTHTQLHLHTHTLPNTYRHRHTQSTCETICSLTDRRNICSVLAMPLIVATVPRTHTLTLTHIDSHLHWSWGALS